MFEKLRAELDAYNSGWHTGFCAGVAAASLVLGLISIALYV